MEDATTNDARTPHYYPSNPAGRSKVHRLFGEPRRDPPRLSLPSFPLLLFFVPSFLFFFASGHIGPSFSPRRARRCVERAIAAIHQPRAIFAIIMEGLGRVGRFFTSYCSFLLPSEARSGLFRPSATHDEARFHLLVKAAHD